MKESEFTKIVIDLARQYGWRVAHFRTALSQSGRWITPVQGDGKGFPDLVLVKGGRLIFAELKVGYNKLRPDQVAWFEALAPCACEIYKWYPKDLDDEILIALGGKRGPERR